MLGVLAVATPVFAQTAEPVPTPSSAPPAPLPAAPEAPPPLVSPSASTSDAATASASTAAAGPVRTDHSPEEDELGFVLGFEAGIALPGGTTATVYDRGFGSGFVVGYHHRRFAIELHVHERFALSASAPRLRGETTSGSLSVGAALLRFDLLEQPMLEIMAGPAMITTPVFALGGDNAEGMALDGVGAMAGAAIGFHLTRKVALTLEVRALLAMRWEQPARQWVVPGELAPGGERMYTTSRGDATGHARTATILLRVFL